MADSIKFEDKEIEAAENIAAEENSDKYIHELKKPLHYEGRTFEKLTFDFESLTGADSLAIEEEMQMLSKSLVVREINGEYQARIAVRACEERISVDVLRALPLKDFNRIVNRARNFC